MNIAEKNGQPSMEEILASIRRIIADEPQGASPVIDLRGMARPLNLLVSDDDQSDFQLPAIFRPQPAPEKPAPLFGRLTDALRSASGTASAELKQMRGGDEPVFDPYLAPAPQNHAPVWPAAEPAELLPNPALSTLNVTRLEPRAVQPSDFPQFQSPVASMQPSPAHYEAPHEPQSRPETNGGWWGGHQQKNSGAPVSQDVKREMTPFRDTRMVRMGSFEPYQPPVESAPPVLAPPIEAPADASPSVDFSAIIPGQIETPPAGPHMAARLWQEPAQVPPAMSYMEPPAGPPAVVQRPEPVPSPEAFANPPVSHPVGSIEDATADLLRPMLRQWLADNMPRMVEKALHIEVAESVRTGRKPAGP